MEHDVKGIRGALRKAFRPYIGETAFNLLNDELKEKETICLITRLQNFEPLIRERSLREVGSLIGRYYALVADAAMQSNGDVDRFCGPEIVVHYSQSSENAVLEAVNAQFRAARDSLEDELGLRIGVGVCGGRVVYGKFGTPDRCTVTAFGAPVICADRLADEERTLAICELFAAHVPNTVLSTDPRISIHRHWNQASPR